MGSKKRRKSPAPAEEQASKRSVSRGGRPALLSWTPGTLKAVLPSERALVFVGRATLAVQSGEVAVCGRVVSAGTGRVELVADDRVGGPLVIEVHSVEGQVPLTSRMEAVFTLSRSSSSSSGGGGSSCSGAPATPSAVNGAAEGSGTRGLGFEAYLDDDSAAPVALPLPQLWRQSAGAVAESLLAGAVGRCAPPAVIAVCGAKKVGKSTFARYLTNTLLNHFPAVAFLDTDCGQPEFTPPGLVSVSLVQQPVLGPPHMHLLPPAAAHFVGDLSPACDPAAYLQHVRSLYQWYCQHAAAATGSLASGGQSGQQQPPQQLAWPPLVVNTHGWVNGMGFDVLVEMLQGLPVTHCIQIASSNAKKNLPPGCFWMPDGSDQGQLSAPLLCWLLPPAPGAGQHEQQQPQGSQPAASETSHRSPGPAASEGGRSKAAPTAVEQRSLQWLAFAQQCVSNAMHGQGAGGPAAADMGAALAATVPVEVDLADVGIQVLHSAVPPSQQAYALNGMVVGLCTAPAAAGKVQLAAAEAGGARSPAAPPSSLPCLGLGVVRAVDGRRGRVHVLTPVPEQALERVTMLQVGRLELPAALLQTASHLSPYLSLFSMSTMGTGSGAIKSRNNLLRQGQL